MLEKKDKGRCREVKTRMRQQQKGKKEKEPADFTHRGE